MIGEKYTHIMDSWQVCRILEELPRDIEIDSKNFEVFRAIDIPKKLLSTLKTGNKRCTCICKSDKGEYHLLETYGVNYWISWPLNALQSSKFLLDYPEKIEQQDQETPKDWSKLQFRDLLHVWKEGKSMCNISSSLELDMKVPNMESGSRTDSMRVEPDSYLEAKYYESLFFIQIPLAYFVKSNISRFKNICKSTYRSNTDIVYQSILAKYLLRVKEFDRRHEGSGVLKSDLGSQVSCEKRDALLAKYHAVGKEQLQNRLSSILKIREIKLQIVLLLEIIAINNLDSNFIDYEHRYGKRLKLRSINIAKKMTKSKRKIQSPVTKKRKEPILDFCEQLDLYLDKLCIQDIILASEPAKPVTEDDLIEEAKKNLLNKHKESSSTGFANFVLIPYYDKKAPNAVRFIIRKLKGPNLRSKRLRDNKIASKLSSIEIAEAAEMAASPQGSSKMSSTPSSPRILGSSAFSRHVPSNTLVPELLASRSNSLVNTFFEGGNSTLQKPSFISRTTSDLTMNLLQKRQLPLTDFSSQNLAVKGSNEFTSTRSFLSSTFHKLPVAQTSFRRVGRRKDINSSIPPENVLKNQERDLVQVESTPLAKSKKALPEKKAHLLNIVESPVNATNDSPVGRDIDTNKGECTDSGENTTHKRNIKRRLFAP